MVGRWLAGALSVGERTDQRGIPVGLRWGPGLR